MPEKNILETFEVVQYHLDRTFFYTACSKSSLYVHSINAEWEWSEDPSNISVNSTNFLKIKTQKLAQSNIGLTVAKSEDQKRSCLATCIALKV
jgi:hypothetical protein